MKSRISYLFPGFLNFDKNPLRNTKSHLYYLYNSSIKTKSRTFHHDIVKIPYMSIPKIGVLNALSLKMREL